MRILVKKSLRLRLMTMTTMNKMIFKTCSTQLWTSKSKLKIWRPPMIQDWLKKPPSFLLSDLSTMSAVHSKSKQTAD